MVTITTTTEEATREANKVVTRTTTIDGEATNKEEGEF